MIDFSTAALLLAIGAVVGLLSHSAIRYLGRATLIAWLLVEASIAGWYLWFGGTIFGQTALAAAIPTAFIILILGMPFELIRRKHVRGKGRQLIETGGFACPHCGYIYDQERERGRCPDCGGACNGAPGGLG